MFSLALLLLALGSTLSCATVPEDSPTPERLVQPPTLPGGEWFRMESAEGDLNRTTWMSDQGQSIATTVTLYGSHPTADQIRRSDDANRATVCEAFESEIVDAHESGDYPTVTWRTRCIYPASSEYPSNLEQIVVQRVIRTDSAVYSIKRIWNRPVTEREVLDWLLYLKRVYVCDVHDDQIPCER